MLLPFRAFLPRTLLDMNKNAFVPLSLSFSLFYLNSYKVNSNFSAIDVGFSLYFSAPLFSEAKRNFISEFALSLEPDQISCVRRRRCLKGEAMC